MEVKRPCTNCVYALSYGANYGYCGANKRLRTGGCTSFVADTATPSKDTDSNNEVAQGATVTPSYLGFNSSTGEHLYKFPDGSVGAIEPKTSSKHKVWSRIEIPLNDLESFSSKHEVLQVLSSRSIYVEVFYVKEEV